LINPDGNLEILAIMQNSGLPERGDNVVTFPEEWLANDEAFAGAMTVKSIEEAFRRRNRGVAGFLQIKAAFESSKEAGQAALDRFYQLAEERTAPYRAKWREIVASGAVLEAHHSLTQLDLLEAHDIRYLHNSQYSVINANEGETLGFCGHLNRYFDPVTLHMEGIREA
jgi:hypothetical protein